MSPAKKYSTAAGMRMALEERLKRISQDSGTPLARLRRHVAFDRFLARVFSSGVQCLVVKGGYTLELRLQRARTTRDIDFSFVDDLGGIWHGKPEDLQLFLHERAQTDLQDFFEDTVGPSTLNLENAPYGGHRYPVEARIAGRRFESFSVDIAAGDAWIEPHPKLQVHDWLDFAGIPPVRIPVISLEQQFAEKLHSYTQEREHPNSRVKDLVDMVLLLGEEMSPSRLTEIVKATFAKRDNSSFPPLFPDPPESWGPRYAEIASTCGLGEDIADGVTVVSRYCRSVGLIK